MTSVGRTCIGALATTALVAALLPLSDARSAEAARASTEAREPSTPAAALIDVRTEDFEDDAAQLPDELTAALARDVGLTGAEWLAQSEAGNAAADVVAELHETIEVVDARLDGYDLVVTVETEDDARIAQSVGARVEYVTAAARSAGADAREVDDLEGLEPAADLRGGMPYAYNDFICSIGLVGIDMSTENVQMMSAGHCNDVDGALREALTINRPLISGGTLGTRTSIGNGGEHVIDLAPNPGFVDANGDEVPTYYDYGITTVTNSSWVGKPEIVTWGNSTSGGPLASAPLVIRDAGPAIAGSTICKSGMKTGWTCGSIRTDGIDALSKVGGSTEDSSCDDITRDYCVGSIQASICVRQGDSGGPAVVGSRAVGITSAASNATSGSCSVSGNIGVFATLYSANPAWEQITKIYPDWEPLIGLASSSRNSTATVRLDPSSTPNLLGRVTGGSIRHGVDVSINGGAVETAAVASNGTWSLPLNGRRGTLDWTSKATWGSQTQAKATSGSIFVADDLRLSGADRYATANAISKNAFPGSPNVPVVYIANGGNFPDALSAGPAAAAEGGPLLLTGGTSLPSSVKSELNRLNPTTIVIVGGSGVVSNSVARALRGYADSVVRIGGSNRYETSRLITQRGLSRGFFEKGQEVWVATGANYADALSAGAAAASAGIPILLVPGKASGIDSATRSFLSTSLRPTVARIAGGTAVVSNKVKNAIDAVSGVSTARYGGASRFDTSLLINKFAHRGSAPTAFLTFGQNFPDALAGGVLAGLTGGPMYITQKGCVEPGVVKHVLDLSPGQITVFGGTAVISNAVRDLKRC